MIKNKGDRAPKSRSKAPVHEQVYQKLREQILFGEIAPGQPVTIQGLTDSLGAGMTPVREAIRRLTANGALVFQGNRRVSVPVLTQSDLDEILYVRKSIESELVRRATGHLTTAHIDELELVDAQLDAAITKGDVAGYMRRNYQFHGILYSQAQSPIMVDIADRLWLRFGPSLRVVCGRYGTKNLPDRHKDLMDALRSSDAEAAATAIEQDVEQGMELVAAVLAEVGTLQ